MRTLEVDVNNDFTLSAAGNLTMLVDLPAVPQEARHFASTLLGEMIHATQLGVPYFEFAFGAAPNISQFEAAMKRRLQQAPGVREVIELSASQNGDTLNYEATLLTEYGRITING